MRTPMAVVLASAFVVGTVFVPASSGVAIAAGMTGDESFEASLQRLIADANTQAVNQLEKDPAMAGLGAATSAGSQEAPPGELMSIDSIRGVPGDPQFETKFAAWLRQVDEQLKEELADDPTGVGRAR
jgi:hypothetical protein